MNPLLFPGDFIAGRYQILNEIGRGGHGTVFRALDSELHVEVAVKVLNGEVADQDQYVLRLWREAQSLAALWGASVVQVHEFDTDERGFVYLVMELLAGEPFDAYLFDLETFGDRMNPAAVLDALGPVANALSVAHTKAIIHRDLKPANIFLLDPAKGGGTRLMDFGLAKTEGFEEITDPGMIAGSPSYISPEIWRSSGFDHRADIYSFGAVVFRALAGQPPFVAESTLKLYEKAVSAPRPSLRQFRPELDATIDTWVQHALAIDAGQRYATMQQLWDELTASLLRGRSPSLELYRRGDFRR